jgi:hypothetical protein
VKGRGQEARRRDQGGGQGRDVRETGGLATGLSHVAVLKIVKRQRLDVKVRGPLA